MYSGYPGGNIYPSFLLVMSYVVILPNPAFYSENHEACADRISHLGECVRLRRADCLEALAMPKSASQQSRRDSERKHRKQYPISSIVLNASR